MTAYLITFDAHAMDHIPDQDFPAVSEAAHAVVREMAEAGVVLFAGGMADESASVVATDGAVTSGRHPDEVGGITIIDVPTREEALRWGAKVAVACRCPQEVRAVMPDPGTNEILRLSASRRDAAATS
jgi:hypothetical protein